MGSGQSIEQKFNVSAVNKLIFEQLTQSSQSSNTGNSNYAFLDVSIEAPVFGCNIDLSQKIDASTQSTSEFKPEQVTALENDVTSVLSAAAEALIESTKGFGAMPDNDQMDIKQEVDLELSNIVKTTLSTENVQKAITNSVNIADGKLSIKAPVYCRSGDSINFSQDVRSQVITKTLSKNITDAISNSKVYQKMDAKLGATAKKENRGPFESIGAMFSGIFGVLSMPVVMSVVISACVAIVVAFFAYQFLLSDAGQNATRNISGAAATRIGGPKLR